MANRANKEKEAALSRDLLCSTLSYSPETGVFKRISGSVTKDAPAGCVMRNGYRVIRVNYSKFLAGRLAWFYVNGEWPEHEIDHINRNRDDNRISNLRVATRQQNCWNLGVSKRNPTGEIGIHRYMKGRDDLFQVKLTRNGKVVFQKKVNSLEKAIIVRDAAMQSLPNRHSENGGCI